MATSNDQLAAAMKAAEDAAAELTCTRLQSKWVQVC